MPPIAEIISVGTELLLGDILNSNAQFLAQQLASLGIPHYYQTTVGDNPERLQRVIETACDRAQLLIFTGGLGPTPDDLTTETIAKTFHTLLVEDPTVIEDIRQKFALRGREMTDNNRKQALRPQGADLLWNSIGTAPGMIWQPRSPVTILTFPGVPTEMRHMWQEVAIPFFQRQGWVDTTIVSQILRFWGVSESALAEKVASFFDLTNPTVAPYANLGEVKLRIAARAESVEAARDLIEPIAAQLREMTGLDCYGADRDSLASVVGDLLRRSGQTLAVAESCTGGGLGQMLTAITGSSDYFWGGVISYDNHIKEKVLQVSPKTLAQDGAVSAATAEQMALGVKTLLGTDWGLSITGIAGPTGGTAQKPVGLVYVGLAQPDGQVISQVHQYGDRGRDWVRQVSACGALDLLRRVMLRSA
jgi:nicotinamide-nucleotide amidase